MAERKTAPRSRQSSSRAKPKQESTTQKADAAKAEEQAESALDDRRQPENADRIRHAAYFFGIVFGALLLNFAVLVLIAGGR